MCFNSMFCYIILDSVSSFLALQGEKNLECDTTFHISPLPFLYIITVSY